MSIINAKGQEPSHLAVMRDHPDIIKYLFEKSVDLESKCFQGKQPLHYAAQHGGQYRLNRCNQHFIGCCSYNISILRYSAGSC